MSGNPSHLVERVAERLRGIGGLQAPEPAPERDIRNVVRRDPPARQGSRQPFARRPAARPDDEPGGEGGGFIAPGYDDQAGYDADPFKAAPDGEGDGRSTAVAVTRRGAVEAAEDGSPPESGGRAMVDASLRAPPVLAEPNTSLSMPDVVQQPPLDMASLEKAGMVVGHKVRTRISEEFRITVGHILRSMHSNYSPGRGAPNVLMVTSARPGEGKSFSSLNLAGSIAQHTQREVLLVDVDAKQRSISPTGPDCSTCRPIPRCASRT